jgi:ATP-binding cassette subfamily B protein
MSTHLRLLTFLKPYTKQVIFAWVVVALSAAFTMVMPQLVSWAIDSGLKPSQSTKLVRDISPTETTFGVIDGSRIEVGQVMELRKEKVRVTAVTGNDVTVERGASGTPRTHVSGERFAPEKPNFEGNTNTLMVAGLAILGAAAARGFFTYWQQFMGEWLGQHVAFDLRNQIYDRLQRLSYAYHDKAQTGQLMSRATQDVEGTRQFIQMGALRTLDLLVRILVAGAMMFIFSNWLLAVVAWALMPVVAFQSIRVQLLSRKIWMEVQDQLGKLTTVLQENMTGVRVVKAFSREKYEEEKFNRVAENLFVANRRQNRVQAQNNPFYQAMSMLSQVAVLWVGAIMITKGDLSAGELTAFLIYLTLLILPMRMLGFIVQQFARAGAAGERIFEILDAESAVVEKPDAIELKNIRGDVTFDNVSFGYDAISPVLRDVNFEASAGMVVALLGPTGSGKTTIVNLLPRFYDVTGGRILVDETDIRDVTLTSLRANIGIIQQDVFLFSATLRDNIAYGAVEATYEQIIEAAKIARIHDFIMSLPDGYDTWVGERGITLSGGQKQRISIARTLLLDPKILILDDSTSSVDTQTEYLIQQALSAVMKGRTTLVIAQRLRTVKNADQILVMNNGTIAERGTHEELIEKDGLYREIYDLELRDQEEALKRAAVLDQTSARAEDVVARARRPQA